MARLTPEALVYDTVIAGDPRVSPDGEQILYSLSRAQRDQDRTTTQIWISNIDGTHPRQITWTGDRNREARWSPDGKWIAFVSDRLQPATGLFVMPTDQFGEAREVARHRQSLGQLAWSRDGRRIAYVTAFDPGNPTEEPPREKQAPKVKVSRRLDYKQDNRGFLNDVRSQVFVVDVGSGERRQLTHESSDIWYPQWSPDGNKLAARVTTHNGTYSRLVVIDAATGSTRRIGPEFGTVGVWAWSPSGDRILFDGDANADPAAELFLYDLASDTVNQLTTDLQCLPEAGFPTVLGPSQPVWLNDSEVVLHAIWAGESGLYRFNVESAELVLEHASRSLSAGFSMDDSQRYAVQACSSLDSLGEIAVYDRRSGERQIVTRNNSDLLKSAPPAQWELLQIDRDGILVDAWLLKPADFDPIRRYPVVLDVHGGPHGSHGYGFNNMQQLLASHGFVVVFSNPRGSGSYGRDFANLVRGDWGGEDYLDLMAVVDTVIEQPYVDAERAGIWGYSYGGFMTAWTIGHTRRFKAAVCGAPCFDLESMYGTSDIAHAWGQVQWGGKPHEASEAFAAHSPSTFIHRATTPTLIVQGEADERCPIGQGEQMFVALKQAGCEVEFARYPGGSHAMMRVGPPSHRADLLERLLAWFTTHLQE